MIRSQHCRYKSIVGNVHEETKATATLLEKRLADENETARDRLIDVKRYSWLNLATAYEKCFQSAAANNLK